jgi:hypothetical protein
MAMATVTWFPIVVISTMSKVHLTNESST